MAEESRKDMVLAWLNDAYSLELGLVPVLENHAKDAGHDTPMGARIQQHADETRRHAELVKGCIERLGGSVSTVKAGMSKAMGAVQSVSTGMYKDELIKNALADFSSEHLEIASYTSLVAAAREMGDEETAGVCERILQDERDMAGFLSSQIPLITHQMLAKAA